jgi:hypothetical protein
MPEDTLSQNLLRCLADVLEASTSRNGAGVYPSSTSRRNTDKLMAKGMLTRREGLDPSSGFFCFGFALSAKGRAALDASIE